MGIVGKSAPLLVLQPLQPEPQLLPLAYPFFTGHCLYSSTHDIFALNNDPCYLALCTTGLVGHCVDLVNL